ncbi:MAG: glycoside hydrolase family 19 protein [Magnetococcales bacterium]|nr:glycoside hydrolase family 19 protein [Magnetococcales bacterium]
MISLDRDRISLIYPHGSADHLDALAQRADEVLSRYGINDNDNRLSFFLAQIGHESGGLRTFAENLNYSAEALLKTWPTHFYNEEDAQEYARQPEKIANRAYANRLGNGDEASGDGWRYRGKGYIQITGKNNYEALGKLLGGDLDLVNTPDDAADPQNALEVACGFWQWKNLNPLCDDGDYKTVTKRINGGLIGWEDRVARLTTVRQVLGMDPIDVEG